MTHIITSLCLRDSGCVDVCPVECIVPGKPIEEWPWYYIDPETCIDCGACIPECPFEAIFPEDEVPSAYQAKGGERQSKPKGTPGFTESIRWRQPSWRTGAYREHPHFGCRRDCRLNRRYPSQLRLLPKMVLVIAR